MRRLFPILLFSSFVSCAHSEGEQITVTSEDDLSGLTVAVVAGSCYDTEYSDREDITLVRYNTHTDILQAVVNNQAQVCVDDEVSYPASVLRDTRTIMSGRGTKEFPTAFALSKENTSLLDAYNEMQREMVEEGTLDSLVRFWLRPEGFLESELPDVPEQASGNPVMVAVSGVANPICFMVNGEWYGLEVDLLRNFGKRIGRKVEFKLYDLASGLMAVNAGMADILAGVIFVTPERSEVYAFTEPYHSFHPGYFVKDMSYSEGQKGLWNTLKTAFRKNLVEEHRWKMILQGVWETIKITVFAILLGSVLGAGICAMMRSRKGYLRSIAHFYNGFMAGIPMLVLLLILFYVVFAGSGLSSTAVAIIAFGLNFASGASGIYNTSLDSIPSGQKEAGLALGFTGLQTFRYIIMPQAVTRGLPLFRSECSGLLKGTSIVGYIAIQDLTRAGDLIRSRTFDALMPLLLVTIIYFVLTWAIGALVGLVARKKREP